MNPQDILLRTRALKAQQATIRRAADAVELHCRNARTMTELQSLLSAFVQTQRAAASHLQEEIEDLQLLAVEAKAEAKRRSTKEK